VDETMVYKRKFVPNLDKLWLKLKPSKELFFHDIITMISEGLNALQSFERWSRHDEMTPYVSVLEEWDDLVGDDWEQPLSNYLNPQDWLDK
jgi:dynein heavy chain, axonemal